MAPQIRESLIDQAVQAHRRWCVRNGFIVDEPASVDFEGDEVVLGNVRGEMVRYEIVVRNGRESLRRLPAR